MLILCLQDVILVLFGHVGQFILQVNVEKVGRAKKMRTIILLLLQVSSIA